MPVVIDEMEGEVVSPKTAGAHETRDAEWSTREPVREQDRLQQVADQLRRLEQRVARLRAD